MKKFTLIVVIFILSIISVVKIYEQKQEQKDEYILESENSADNKNSDKAAIDDNNDSDEAADVIIRAYICGKVKEQGVYSLKEGSRIIDLVDMAGGFLEGAAGEYVNLAAVVNDGDRIYIPSVEEIKENGITSPLSTPDSGNGTSSVQNGKININTADTSKLMTLPGIGETKANAIVNYRIKHGKFNDVKDIMNVSGIGNATFNNIKDFITVK